MRTPRLSVIIVTWNVRDMTLACLDALLRETRDIGTEVILVDNASSDETVAAVRAAYPQVRIIANDANVGFPAANNQALAVARGEYVLFLNPDTEVHPGAVTSCVEELDRDPRVGMVGCKLVLEDGSTQMDCARRRYLLRHLVMELFYLHTLFPRNRVCGDHLMSWWDHEGIRDVEAICGAFMLVRAAVARAVGGLPDKIFMYHEDLAFCSRVRDTGLLIRYRGDVSTLHRWRGSSRRSPAPLALLEGVYKLQFIRDEQGAAAAAIGRVVFGIRCVLRLGIAGVGALLPIRRLREQYPRVFDVRMHALQLAWTVAPGTVDHLMPGRPDAAAVQAPEQVA
jgi:GT2 family glycosyltransferase